MKKRYIAAAAAIAGLVSIPLIAQAFGSSQVTVTPNGPLDGGNFGPKTPGTVTSGLQEALDSGARIVSVKGANATYTTTMPLSINASDLSVSIDPLATVKVVSQIDGGVFQVVRSGLSNIAVQGGTLDANNLSMMGVWIAKMTPGWKLRNLEVKNVRGIYGLQTAQNPCGVIAHAGGAGLLDTVIVHDVSAPGYTGGNGSGIWLTGDLGITQPENTVARYCNVYSTLNVAPNELIDAYKLDTNTLGITLDHCSFSDISGDGFDLLAGGTGNISNGHIIRSSGGSNARIGLNMNGNNGGHVYGTTVDRTAILNCRQNGIYENDGADYGTFTNNTVPQGLVAAPGAGLHDVRTGNIGF